MSQTDGHALAGLSKSDAVDELLDADDERDPDEVAATLDHVTDDDGVVSLDGVESGLADASKVVSTSETRVELASMALESARESAESAPDLEIVQSRLDAFESRLEAVRSDASDLGSDLDALVDRSDDPDAIYEVATGIRRLTANANRVQQTADRLQTDVESFGDWLGDSETRFRDLAADVDGIENFHDELVATTDEIEAVVARDGDEPVPRLGTDATGDPAVAWADANLWEQVMALLVTDARAELADLRAWADHDGEGHADEGHVADVEARLDDLDARLADAGDRLDEVARPAWRDEFSDRLTDFASATDDLEPPIDWGEVQATFDEYRPPFEDGA